LKKTEDDGAPCILEADKSSKEYRKSWARLIQKIYEIDPLTCPKCRETGTLTQTVHFGW
jgi:hypothetical protein